MRELVLLVFALAWCTTAAASDRRAVQDPGGQTCAMQETAQVGVTWNNVMVTKLDRIGAEMDQKIGEIAALAKQTGIEKVEVQSYSYNVYPVSSGHPMPAGAAIPYQYSGNASFAIEPCAKASELMSLLANKGYSANLNVNAYRQCQ